MAPEGSTASLKVTSTTHDMLTGLLGASMQLVTALEKADWLDQLLIFAGLAFFALVVLFILKQRIVDLGLRIAFVGRVYCLPGTRATQSLLFKKSQRRKGTLTHKL